MKVYLIFLLAGLSGMPPASAQPPSDRSDPFVTPSPTEHVFIITTDGFRWQEVFSGADSSMLNDDHLVKDPAQIRQQYWDPGVGERRKKLMPFFWNIIATQGQLYGNRQFANKVGMRNFYWISYPGYNEILTGFADPILNPNLKLNNKNRNILEFLNRQPKYKGKVVAFGSWNVFPFILNEKRSNIPVDCGFHNRHTRYDSLTFACAKDYIVKNHPAVVFIGFGETDEDAHARRYDLYLQSAAAVDHMIAELWNFVQSDPEYKDHTTFIITTDHGRGSDAASWHTHGLFTKGSGQTWLACIGAGIRPMGEMKTAMQIYGRQLAATISQLLGENFQTDRSVGKAISLPHNPYPTNPTANPTIGTAVAGTIVVNPGTTVPHWADLKLTGSQTADPTK